MRIRLVCKIVILVYACCIVSNMTCAQTDSPSSDSQVLYKSGSIFLCRIEEKLAALANECINEAPKAGKKTILQPITRHMLQPELDFKRIEEKKD